MPRFTVQLLLCALIAAGCGGSDTTASAPPATGRAQQKPATVIRAMADALRRIHSYHYEGTISTVEGSARISVDAARNGSVRVGIEGPGRGSAEIVVVPPAAYIRADTEFWRAHGYPSIADKLGSHWVKTPRELATALTRETEPLGPRHLATCARRARRLEFGGTTSVAGTDAMIIIERRGPGDAPTAVYLPLRGRALPLRMVTSHPAPSGRHSACSPLEQGFTAQDIAFSRFNEDIRVEPPENPIVIG